MIYDEVTKYIVSHLYHMVQLAKWQGMTVYLGTLLPVNRPLDRGNDNEKINNIIKKVNREIRENASQYGVVVLDYYELFINKKTKMIDESLTDDGLHPNKMGNRKIQQYLNKKIYLQEMIR